MKTRSASASGKIILSGEYAVLFGKRGIAIPSDLRMNITLEESQKNNGITIHFVPSPLGGGEGVGALWIDYARKVAEKIINKAKPVSGTLTIENALPLGKGMGSSTSLIIAMCRCLIGPDSAKIALELENEMNTGNSGIDFTVIWEEKPILFEKDRVPEQIELSSELLRGMKLIDTGNPSEPTPTLVAWIRSRYEDNEPEVRQAIDTIGRCTERILEGESIRDVLHDHHRAQIALGVVPESVQTMIAEIEVNGGAAKILGAGSRSGGGGMVLVLP
ncbi:hypothetical protein EXS65_00075 [Candidatus Peribacteria bacterium]|nr:hypothetical protein [Candidatus Peribacteria bacterium]